MRLWCWSHRWTAKARTSLRIRAVSPEPSLFAHMKYGRRQRVRPKIWHLALLDGCACVFEKWIYRGQKVPKSHESSPLISASIVVFWAWWLSASSVWSCLLPVDISTVFFFLLLLSFFMSRLTTKPTKWHPRHPPSLIRVFAVRMKKAWVLSYQLSAQ